MAAGRCGVLFFVQAIPARAKGDLVARILLIDDDSELSGFLRSALDASGHHVDYLENAAGALDRTVAGTITTSFCSIIACRGYRGLNCSPAYSSEVLACL